MKITYSALDTFKNCPQKYYFQEVKRIPAPKSKEAVFGSVVHTTLKFLHSSTPFFPTLEQVCDYYKKHWPEPGKVRWLPEEEKAYFEQGLKLLEAYYKTSDFKSANVIDLELYFEVPIQDEKGELHLLTGKIDRIDKREDGTLEIIDYKTARRMPPQKNVDNNLQLSLYHLGVRYRWPEMEKPVVLTLYFLRHGEKLSTKRTKEELKKTEGALKQGIKEIQKSSFEPHPGPLCDWCGYRKICPAWKHLYRDQETASPTEKEIDDLIEEYFQLQKQGKQSEKRLTEIKSKLSGYMDTAGLERLFGNEGYIARLLQKRYGYDAAKVKEVLAPLGKWEDVLTIDAKKLEKVTGALPEEIRDEIKKARIVVKEFKTLMSGK